MATLPTNDGPQSKKLSRFVEEKVKTPSFILMLFGISAIVWGMLQCLGFVITFLVMANANGAPREDEIPLVLAIFGGGGCGGLASSLVGLVAVIGARSLKRFRGYSMVLLASIVAILPCGVPCCLLGFPIGLWVFLILRDADVRDAFAMVAEGRELPGQISSSK